MYLFKRSRPDGALLAGAVAHSDHVVEILVQELGEVLAGWLEMSTPFSAMEAAMKWRAALEAGGAVYKRTCLWVKPDGKPQYSGDPPGIGYESIVVCHAPGRSKWNGGGSHGVFIVNKGGDPRTGHQTQKPVALMELLVRPFSNPGELILDVGSGTTGVGAIPLGRRFLGWEMNSEYVAIAEKRMAAAREQLELNL